MDLQHKTIQELLVMLAGAKHNAQPHRMSMIADEILRRKFPGRWTHTYTKEHNAAHQP